MVRNYGVAIFRVNTVVSNYYVHKQQYLIKNLHWAAH